MKQVAAAIATICALSIVEAIFGRAVSFTISGIMLVVILIFLYRAGTKLERESD